MQLETEPPLQQVLWHFWFMQVMETTSLVEFLLNCLLYLETSCFIIAFLFLYSSSFTSNFVFLLVCFSERIWASWKMRNVGVFQFSQIVPYLKSFSSPHRDTDTYTPHISVRQVSPGREFTIPFVSIFEYESYFLKQTFRV